MGQGILVNQDILHYYHAADYTDLGKYDLALADLDRLSQSMSSDASYHFVLGQVYAKQGHTSAIDQFSKGIQEQPGIDLEALLYYARGEELDRAGLYDKGNKDVGTAFDLDDKGVIDYAMNLFPLNQAIEETTNLIAKNTRLFYV